MSGFLYAIKLEEAVKFGVSIDVQKRLGKLQCSLPITLKLLAALPIPGNQYKFESRVHKCFQRFRIRGEWYRLVGPVSMFVDAMNAQNAEAIEKQIKYNEWMQDKHWDIPVHHQRVKIISV